PDGCRREVAATPSTGASARADDIRLAALLPLSNARTGGLPDTSEAAGLNALALAVTDVNSQNGIDGRRFTLYVCDTGRDSSVIAEQTRWMVEQLGVPAVVTSGSRQTLAVTDTPVQRDAGTLVISATATAVELSGVFGRHQTPWRIAPSDALQVRVMTRLLTTNPGYAGSSRYGIVFEDGPYGLGIASALREQLVSVTDAGTERVQTFGYLPPLDVPSVLDKLAPFHAGAGELRTTVLIGFPIDIVKLVESAGGRPALAADGGHRWFLSDSAKDLSLITPGTGPSLLGALGTAPAQGSGTAYLDFRTRYLATFRSDPDGFSYTGHSYDAAMVVMLSAAWAARDDGAVSGPRLSDGMRQLSAKTGPRFRLGPTEWRDAAAALGRGQPIDVEGASGELDFDVNTGAPSARYEVWRVADAGFSTVRFEDP
ncbi:MAG: ABC transporter substrate-binding protein, partial [Myxococcaceae bacterium]|nr:ABC transporter substrate-binding protein [Myxococcaceae bacterium]